MWSADYPLILLRDDQERILRRAGFREIWFYGTFEFDPYDTGESSRLITVARK